MKQIKKQTLKSKIIAFDNENAHKKNLPKLRNSLAWPLKVLILTFSFSVCFSVLSEIINSKVGVIISLLIIVVFFLLNIIFDVIGVATTVCEKQGFVELAKHGDKNAKIAIRMVENNEKVCSFCCDIIGDICGILSGSAGASLIYKFHFNLTSAELILFSTLISALIASITVFAKAVGKNFAIRKSSTIVYFVGKVGTLFLKRGKNGKTKK